VVSVTNEELLVHTVETRAVETGLHDPGLSMQDAAMALPAYA
jgi:hypothetical protein